ncbi:metal-sulfur cluster biosynthetic enzyme [Amycolatopsis bartoniae]|uniref:Metal-sulfur cluster biosynthesis protein n=1 Tax=Amycolatopsis bartoniae TaxID=941986 RepID=A0A8H9IQD4_9PSEU|nr:metal-sulfur cluster assembly factor [Amycolatopsis bartoniae]MBB2939243.1 metal-sulfur cluster biosynthetic enzyme [Amycolatopsis bartoniae]TVT09560.1 metal-sulfur cluster assembly factor [Amycolatopsis bartoniae]GHF37912.1 metal-sulfur cluster biosynthesis protein [Amycolatopsis bartoniae]
MSDETQTREGRTAADLPEQAQPAADLAKVEDIEEAMRDVVDPELGINVVDLGLVYDIRVEPDNTATLDMTLTSAACPLTDVIEDQTASVLVGSGAVVKDFRINWVWMPPWGPEKITEDGREQLRALGFTV